jgi:hypothetical protein
VYADNDPIVLTHGRARLARDGSTAIVTADMREPGTIIDAPETKALIDFSRPVGVLFIAVLHFAASPGHPRYVAGHADPGEIVAAFRDVVAPGSHVALTHALHGQSAENVAFAQDGYKSATSPLVIRRRDEIEALFDGLRLVPPGVVPAWQWRSGPDESPRTGVMIGGVGVKDA